MPLALPLSHECSHAAQWLAGMAGNDGGQTAQFVSNASFATLALIYTVTELLDLSDRVRRQLACCLASCRPAAHIAAALRALSRARPGWLAVDASALRHASLSTSARVRAKAPHRCLVQPAHASVLTLPAPTCP